VSIDAPVIIPQIQYLTNDAWNWRAASQTTRLSAADPASYSKGLLYVLVIPDDFGICTGCRGGARAVPRGTDRTCRQARRAVDVSLFAYDNNTFIVNSFLDGNAESE